MALVSGEQEGKAIEKGWVVPGTTSPGKNEIGRLDWTQTSQGI
jgi:hypothetical protein